MRKQWVVKLDDVEATIRSAIRVHARKAGHKDGDVQYGCPICNLLLAMNANMNREAELVEMEETCE